jgi:hypothetical protein
MNEQMEHLLALGLHITELRENYNNLKDTLIMAQEPWTKKVRPLTTEAVRLTLERDKLFKEVATINADCNSDGGILYIQGTLLGLRHKIELTLQAIEREGEAAYREGNLPSKTVDLNPVTLKFRKVVTRKILDPLKVLDQLRESGLDSIIKSVKLMVDTKRFNQWVDLHEPDGVDRVETLSVSTKLADE